MIDVSSAVSGLEIETPSWGYGNSGTRFRVFPQPGVPRDPFEKVEDAATVLGAGSPALGTRLFHEPPRAVTLGTGLGEREETLVLGDHASPVTGGAGSDRRAGLGAGA